MRGEILSFDEFSGNGLISGDDGVRYGFSRTEIQAGGVIRPGARVDFVAEGDQATQIMVLAGAAAAPIAAAAPAPGAGYDFASAMFSFNGRLRRQHFWISWLILFAVGVITGFIPFLGALISIVMIWPNLAIGVKRLHDMGKTGWFILAPVVVNIIGTFVIFGMIGASAMANATALENEDPAAILALIGPAFGMIGVLFLLNIAFLLWIGITDSQRGDNAYGPNPKGE